MRRPLVIALLLASVVPLAADDRWTKVTTPHFELYTSGGEGPARRTLLHFEQMRAFFLELLGIESRSDEPVRLIGFRNAKEFEPFRPNEFSSAYYLAAHDREYIVIGDIGLERHETAIHEYVHLLVRNTDAKFVPWVNEGLAELYATMSAHGKEVWIGEPNQARLAYLQQRKRLPISRVFEVRHGDPEYSARQHAGIFYSQSWALTHMLSLGADFAQKTPDLLKALATGEDSAAAIERVHGLTPDDLESALERYVSGGKFYLQRVPIRLEKSALEPVFAEASDLEVGLVLAQLKASTVDGRQDAVTRYEQLEQQYPDDSRIPEALGYLAWRDQDRDRAIGHMKRAAELDSKNYKLYYDLAGLSRSVEPAEFEVELLEKTLQLKPDYTDARRYLANVYLRQQNWVQAVLHFNKVDKVETNAQAFNVSHGRAYGYFRLDRLDQAQNAATQAKQFAETLSETSAIDNLLQAIDYRLNGPAETIVALDPEAKPNPGPAPDAIDLPQSPRSGQSDSSYQQQTKQTYQGALRAIDCSGGGPVMHIESSTGVRTFAIDEMDNVVILGQQGEAEFTCGPQTGHPIRIEYEDPLNSTHAEGRIRLIEFL